MGELSASWFTTTHQHGRKWNWQLTSKLYNEKGEEVAGWTDPKRRVVSVQACQSKPKIFETLGHELFHVVVDESRGARVEFIDEDTWEENFARLFAVGGVRTLAAFGFKFYALPSWLNKFRRECREHDAALAKKLETTNT